MKAWLGEPEMAIEVETDWAIGSPIVVRGFHHTAFSNSGVVLHFAPPTKLVYTHASSLSRLPDEPASYTTFDFTLDEQVGERTALTFAASAFPTETIFKHLRFYWRGTLAVLKQHAEAHARSAATAEATTQELAEGTEFAAGETLADTRSSSPFEESS
jgi:hypothetical protein